MVQSPENTLSQHLDRDERLLWSGKPRGGIRFRVQDVFLIPFSILWCGFAIYWEASAIQNGAPIFFMLWGIPFICVGLFFVSVASFSMHRNRARTYYGVTSERILIVSGLLSQQTKSLQLRTLTDVTLTQRSDGSGTVTFGPTHPMYNMFPAGAWPGSGRYGPLRSTSSKTLKMYMTPFATSKRPRPDR